MPNINVPVTLVPHGEHGEELHDQAATFDASPWLARILAEFPEELVAWTEEGAPSGEMTDDLLDGLIDGPEGSRALKFAEALGTLGLAYLVRIDEDALSTWLHNATAGSPAEDIFVLEPLTGNARTAAVEAIRRLADVSKPVACNVVDNQDWDQLGEDDHYLHLMAASIMQDCAEGTVSLMTVGALLEAATIAEDVSVRPGGHLAFEVAGQRCITDTFTRVSRIGIHRRTVDTDVPASGMGNPWYVARKLANAAVSMLNIDEALATFDDRERDLLVDLASSPHTVAELVIAYRDRTSETWATFVTDIADRYPDDYDYDPDENASVLLERFANAVTATN